MRAVIAIAGLLFAAALFRHLAQLARKEHR